MLLLKRLEQLCLKNKEFFANNNELIAKLKDEQSDVYRAARVKEKESLRAL